VAATIRNRLSLRAQACLNRKRSLERSPLGSVSVSARSERRRAAGQSHRDATTESELTYDPRRMRARSSCNHCPAFQRAHTSVLCAAENPARFHWAIDTTSEDKIYTSWCCIDPLRPRVRMTRSQQRRISRRSRDGQRNQNVRSVGSGSTQAKVKRWRQPHTRSQPPARQRNFVPIYAPGVTLGISRKMQKEPGRIVDNRVNRPLWRRLLCLAALITRRQHARMPLLILGVGITKPPPTRRAVYGRWVRAGPIVG
jgi:hypothetical protein